MKNDSAYDIIMQGIRNIEGKQKYAGDHVMVCCPFHSESNPSCGIYLGKGMSLPFGAWHCFGCNEKGLWNKLAEKLKLPKIKEWSTYETGVSAVEIEDEHITLSKMLTNMRVDHSVWPTDMEWRGFDGQLVRDVGGLIVNDRVLNSLGVFFPVYIGRELKGGVKAAYKKQDKMLSYVTTKGSWVGKYGLFGYNLVKKMKRDYVVLVEGPRDALRLLQNDIPALAILGANNFNSQKALMVSSLYPEVVYCLPDNDDAGKKMKKVVKAEMSKLCTTESIRLPEDVKDPEELKKRDIKLLKSIICS